MLVNDPTIPDDSFVYRRIEPKQTKWIEEGGEWIPYLRDGAFQDQSDEVAMGMGLPRGCMSVGLATLLAADNKSPDIMLKDLAPTWGLARLQVGSLRAAGNGVMPWHWDSDAWHAVIFNTVLGLSKNKIKNARHEGAVWEIAPSARPPTS